MNDKFMRHFRWLTPLLLSFAIFMLGKMFGRFERLEDKVEGLSLKMVAVQTFLRKELAP